MCVVAVSLSTESDVQYTDIHIMGHRHQVSTHIRTGKLSRVDDTVPRQCCSYQYLLTHPQSKFITFADLLIFASGVTSVSTPVHIFHWLVIPCLPTRIQTAETSFSSTSNVASRTGCNPNRNCLNRANLSKCKQDIATLTKKAHVVRISGFSRVRRCNFKAKRFKSQLSRKKNQFTGSSKSLQLTLICIYLKLKYFPTKWEQIKTSVEREMLLFENHVWKKLGQLCLQTF